MFDKSILNPFMTGTELTESLQVLPKYDESIRNKDKSIRLIALSDLYDIYISSDMSKEIYTKLYLSIIRSLDKKATIESVRQCNENYRAIRQMGFQGILGGADSYTIIGPSGVGKSSAISRSINLITGTQYIECSDKKICPALIVQSPFDASFKGLAYEILRKVDSVLETNYYRNAIRSRATTDVLIGMISQVSMNHLGLLVIDEIQNVAVSKNGRTFINSVMQLINSSGISICMVGTPECRDFFEQKFQLARRSMGLTYFPLPLDEHFEKLCRIVFCYQYTQRKSDFNDSFLEWLYEHSGGLVSLVISLIHDAQEIAILSGSEKLDIKSLNDAFEKRSTLLHGYLQGNSQALPKTGKITKKNERNIIGKTAILEKKPAIGKCGSCSIMEIVEESKKNTLDVVEVLKQYIIIEEIGKEGCTPC